MSIYLYLYIYIYVVETPKLKDHDLAVSPFQETSVGSRCKLLQMHLGVATTWSKSDATTGDILGDMERDTESRPENGPLRGKLWEDLGKIWFWFGNSSVCRDFSNAI